MVDRKLSVNSWCKRRANVQIWDERGKNGSGLKLSEPRLSVIAAMTTRNNI